jgi:hypothetical protein
MTAARRHWALQISGAIAALGLVLGAYGHLRLNALLDVAHFNANGLLLETAAWQNDLLAQAVVLAIGGALLLLGALGLMLAVSWKLRFPEALLAGAASYLVIADGARAFVHQLFGGVGGTSDVTFTIAPMLMLVGIAGFVVAAIILVGAIVGVVRATSPQPAAVSDLSEVEHGT